MLTIKAQLKQINKSVSWLSKQTGMPYANVHGLVNGYRLPRSGELERIEKAIQDYLREK